MNTEHQPSNEQRLKPCVFFDRDGIVNRYPGEGEYVEQVDGFHLLPEFFEALQMAHDRGYVAVIVTNQRGVARGRTSIEALREIHAVLDEAVRQRGLSLLDIMVCTDADDSSFHRKPNPGMILEAAETHGLDLERSWMVGDSERDIIAGKRAGCVGTILVKPDGEPSIAEHRVATMQELLPLFDAVLPNLST